jgi:hypothetical protein
MFEYPLQNEIRQRYRLMRTALVFGLLTVAALAFSYLGAFAISELLVRAGVIEPWTPDRDPRWHWMVVSFGTMTGGFCLIALLLKWTTGRQMKRLDALSEDAA